jgi:hypothetical protein
MIKPWIFEFLVMQTIGLTALVTFGLVTPAMAAATVPEEYQGVWAAARDCKEKFQNVRNMGVTQAGSNAPNSGHHHLLIDVNEPLEPNEPIPQDKTHLHFGAGQTEARIELPPGRHTLQLVLGDAKHYPFNPPVISKKVTITVK